MTLSHKARLVVWHAAVIAVILGAAAVALDWTVRRVVLNQFDAALLHLANTEAEEIVEGGDARQVHTLSPRGVRRLAWSFHPVVQIIDLEGNLMAVGPGLLPDHALPISPALLDRLRRGKITFETVSVPESSLRVVTIPFAIAGRRFAVQMGQALGEARMLLQRLRWLLVATWATVLVAIVLTDLLLTRRALGPIDAIVQQAQRIGDSNLTERLPSSDVPGEVARLVETFNEMLSRLHDSFQAQRRFTADAAHELRSPLTRLRTEIEVALRRPRLAEDYRAVLEVSLDELQRLARLTEDLLALARLDAGEGREAPIAPTALNPIVAATLERFGPVAAARHVQVVLEECLTPVVHVLPAVIDVVVANVLDNAIKFSPPGGRVTVRVLASETDALVAVTDAGHGIPVEELPRVFERFFRGRAPRATDVAGVGLGLAIARTLAERQHGAISIESVAGGGTTVTIRLPLAAVYHPDAFAAS
jgi:two-component system OmpR family sensor kinase